MLVSVFRIYSAEFEFIGGRWMNVFFVWFGCDLGIVFFRVTGKSLWVMFLSIFRVYYLLVFYFIVGNVEF